MAKADNSKTIEGMVGGLPGIRQHGLSTNQAVNLSGFQIDTSGNMSGAGFVTGPTGSFGVLQVTSAQITGPTGTTAALGPVGAADGGPTTAAQAGWVKVTVNGTQYWTPIWA